MNVLLLGATGGTGKRILEQGLARGHRMTAFVRTPSRLGHSASEPRIVVGDARDTEALTAAAREHEVVISALGTRSRLDRALLPACTRSLVSACSAAGVERIVCMSSALLFPIPGMLAAFFRWFTRGALEGAREADQLVVGSRLRYTIVRPVRLTDGPASGVRASVNGLPDAPRPISRADVAAFMLDVPTTPQYDDAIVGLCR